MSFLSWVLIQNSLKYYKMLISILAAVNSQALYYVRQRFYYSFQNHLFALTLRQAYLCTPFHGLDFRVLPCYPSLALGAVPVSLISNGSVCLRKEGLTFKVDKGPCNAQGLEKQINLRQDFSLKQAKVRQISERITQTQEKLLQLVANLTEEDCWIEERILYCKGAFRNLFQYEGISVSAERLIKNCYYSFTGYRCKTVFQVDQYFQIGLLLLGDQIQISGDRTKIKFNISQGAIVDWRKQRGIRWLMGGLSLLPLLVSVIILAYYRRRPQKLIGKYQSVINSQVQISTDRSKDEGQMKSMEQFEEYDFQSQNSDI